MTILYQYCYFVVPFLPGQNFGDTSMRHTQSAGDITRSDLQILMNVMYIFVPYRCTVGADKNGTPVFVHFSAQAASNSNISEAIM